MAVCCNKEYLGPLLNRLLNAVEEALIECGRDICRAHLDVSGAPAWDSQSQLWVSVGEIRHLNITDNGVMRCIGQFEADVNVGYLRCASTQDDRGNPPPPDVLSLEVLAVLQDRAIINSAIVCLFGEQVDADVWTLGNWHSLGPEGGLVGGEVSLTLRFSDPSCA